MKILLLGKNGQLGWELQRSLAPLGEVVALSSTCKELCGNLADLEGIAKTVRTVAPRVIVNASAYTAVDKAESDQEAARRINALAPGVLADEARRCGALLVHYSTDYVFDGSGTKPWEETDATGPLNTYGLTKLEGEQAIAHAGCAHLIFRTSWVHAARGKNFARTMLQLASERETLTVIDDQAGAPTGADLLADVSAHAIRQEAGSGRHSGIYHLAAGGETTWHGYAEFVCGFARDHGIGLKVKEITPVPSSRFPTPARRPHNSRLDTARVRGTFGLRLPHWKDGVGRMLTEILL